MHNLFEVIVNFHDDSFSFSVIEVVAANSKTLWQLFWQSDAFIQSYCSGIKIQKIFKVKIFKKEKNFTTQPGFKP